MKLSIVALATAMLLFAASCTKSKNVQPGIPTVVEAIHQAHKDGGDDDDLPITMEVVQDNNGFPEAGVFVEYSKGFDTIRGFTNAGGQYEVHLTSSGIWVISLKKPGRQCINTSANIVDSFSVRNDTMVAGICN